MGGYRFARRPRWLLTHLLVLAIVALFVSLGFWQLRRLDERRDRNDLIEQRSSLPAAPLDELVAEVGEGVDELRYRHVTATGTWVEADLRSVRTTQDGAPGFHVVSLLRQEGDDAVAVLRGFTAPGPDGLEPAVPATNGSIAVEGFAIPLERSSQPLRRAVDQLAEEYEVDVLPVLVQAAASEPSDADVLRPVELPPLDDGPHRDYAVQWFLFAAVGVAGYPFLLRREARRREAAGGA